MINAFLPLRSGSKSIKDKNIKIFNGKPLCFWVLKACQESHNIDRVIVAVDSDKYKNLILGFGFDKVNFYDRQKSNSQDVSSTESVILEFLSLNDLPAESKFILIQATSPHLKSSEIDAMIDRSLSNNCDIVSCVRIKRFIWGDKGMPLNYTLSQRPRRQDFQGFLVENGAVYISNVKKIQDSNCRISGLIETYEMNENSFIEIDESHDFLISELLMKIIK
jgi:CMP-N-acetylneuraminic acid synthetase